MMITCPETRIRGGDGLVVAEWAGIHGGIAHARFERDGTDLRLYEVVVPNAGNELAAVGEPQPEDVPQGVLLLLRAQGWDVKDAGGGRSLNENEQISASAPQPEPRGDGNE